MLGRHHLWNAHPLALATGTAWIQVGIGLALIVSNGALGRLAAGVTVGWALLIWLVGNGAGGAFASGASILFGWPGATLFYAFAGVVDRRAAGLLRERYSRVTLRCSAVLLVVGGFWQSLPSDGFWHGGNSNALTAMTRTMTETAQPHALCVDRPARGRPRRAPGGRLQRHRHPLAGRARRGPVVREHALDRTGRS